MLTAAHEQTDGHYERALVIHEMDDDALNHAKEIFAEYRKRGVILNSDFGDAVWLISDQRRTVGLKLAPAPAAYHENAGTWIGCDYHCYTECIKTYIAFHLGELGADTLRELANTFTSLAEMTSDTLLDAAADNSTRHIAGLLQIVPGSSELCDFVIETLEEKAERRICNKRKGQQRILADFKTYFEFNDLLCHFWPKASKKQKLFYFPLYFWWTLTAILPLRPTELLLTPRDCLEYGAAGECLLTIRRTKLKSGHGKIAYRIDKDYELKQYAIHKELAGELQFYLEATAKMHPTEIDTLFLQQPHFNYVGRYGHIKNRYYTYGNLYTCLRYFYQEIVWTHNREINAVKFGDTRHIAMASLILSGGSPVICRELAGHSNIDISSHYYANISSLVECVTLERYRKSKGGGLGITGTQKYPLSSPKDGYRLPDGWCDEPSLAHGDISECLKAAGEHGEIGDCTRCGHFWPDNPGVRLVFFDETAGKEGVDLDCRCLMQMIEAVRKGAGYTEDIGAALLRLQRSSSHYSDCLWEKFRTMDGALWQDLKN